ncbi:hypothetical protein RJ639_040279 [Escallonia herrerae]|uniref:Uncharacterized protein n=1 Tax=Escallonia herrerae TaxID=1293975 RepID=A0AA89B7W0_9ASTE|nr:hypothetical protein RJ639_040279 [Escallonia herrerae]
MKLRGAQILRWDCVAEVSGLEVPNSGLERKSRPREVPRNKIEKTKGDLQINPLKYVKFLDQPPQDVVALKGREKRESVAQAEEATHLAEELSKRESDLLIQVEALEKRLERAKRKIAEKRSDDGLKIYEMGFLKAKEIFTKRFFDIPLDGFVMPAIGSPTGKMVLPSEAGDTTSQPPKDGPSGTLQDTLIHVLGLSTGLRMGDRIKRRSIKRDWLVMHTSLAYAFGACPDKPPEARPPEMNRHDDARVSNIGHEND